MNKARGVGGLVVGLLFASCKGPGEAPPPEMVASSPEATGIVAALGERFRHLDRGPAKGFQLVEGGLRPQFSSAEVAVSARVVLPQRSTAPVRLEDTRSTAQIDIALEGARDATGLVAGGLLVYPRSHVSGATVLQRPVANGVEDFLSFEDRPATAAIAYRVALRHGVAGLRLVANTLEMLDEHGAPRLRVSPPYLVGADGTRTDAALSVAGCDVDEDPAAPWDRRVVPPGAKSCLVRGSWNDEGVAYPALLDPSWTTTGSMSVPRQDHTATLLSTGKVLVAGGRSSTTTTTSLATAELFDRTTG